MERTEKISGILIKQGDLDERSQIKFNVNYAKVVYIKKFRHIILCRCFVVLLSPSLSKEGDICCLFIADVFKVYETIYFSRSVHHKTRLP